MAVAAILQHEVAESFLTYKRLEALTGISATSVGQILRGEKSPTITQLGRLCAALGLEVANVVTVAESQA